MSDSTVPASRDYIRGGGGSDTDPRRVLRILVWVLVAVLAGVTVALAVTTAGNGSQADRLRSRGVAVQATVTGCLGIGDGVGMGVEYWQCKGSYSLGGPDSYDAVIGGSRRLLGTGTLVAARVVPGDPASLTLASALPAPASISSYVPAIVTGGLTLMAGLLAIGTGLRDRRKREHPASGESPVVGGPRQG